MRTSELTAAAVLKGENIVQMSKDVGQRVAFQAAREKVRAQLHAQADDPDLIKVFDYVISVGVGTTSYIDSLMDFGQAFVDSNLRQLRFSACGIANKICAQAPWTKKAVIKRALKSKPINGFCANPEIVWTRLPWEECIELLEDILRFFHVE